MNKEIPIWNPIYLLNSTVLTSFGTWSYRSLSQEGAKNLVTFVSKEGIRYLKTNVISAIGHQLTAEMLSEFLGVLVPINRIQANKIRRALVFRLKVRLGEGVVVKTLSELCEICEDNEPFELGLLKRLEE